MLVYNYLLSKERNKISNSDGVTHADIENWKIKEKIGFIPIQYFEQCALNPVGLNFKFYRFGDNPSKFDFMHESRVYESERGDVRFDSDYPNGVSYNNVKLDSASSFFIEKLNLFEESGFHPTHFKIEKSKQ